MWDGRDRISFFYIWLSSFNLQYFWRDFSKMYVFEIIVWYLTAIMTWACIWTLYSADLCFCFVSDLFYFLTQPVQFDIEPRIIRLAQDCFGYTWYLLLVFCVCASTWILKFFLVLWRTALELYGNCIVSVDCLEYCNPFHNINFFQSITVGDIFIL